MGLEEFFENFRKLILDIPFEEFLEQVMLENKEILIDYNLEQMSAGKMPDDTDIEPEYADAFYEAFKKAINPNPQRSEFTPDLNLEGGFYRGTDINNNLEFINTDEKAPELLSKYGDVLGVSEENLMEFGQDFALPELIILTQNYFSNAIR